MIDSLRWLLHRINYRFSTFYLRVNDGEMMAMAGDRGPGDLSCDGTAFYPEMGLALVEVFEEMALCPDWLDSLRIGSTWWTHPDADSEKFVSLLNRLYLTSRINWDWGHSLLTGLVTGETKSVVAAINEGDNTVLVGNSSIEPASYCLGARFIEVPKTDSWLASDKIEEACIPHAKEGRTFIWCGGMGLKPLAWKLWNNYPTTTHLDFGHLFDGCFGVMSREWLRKKEQPWWRPFSKDFAPWVRSFVP